MNVPTNTVVSDLCEDRFCSTALTSAWETVPLTDEEYEGDGPAIEDIVAHAEGDNFTSHFSYRVVLEYKFRNGGWNTVTSPLLIPGQSTPSGEPYVIGAVFNDRAKLGIRIRVSLQFQVASGGSGTHSGNVSVSIATRYKQGC